MRRKPNTPHARTRSRLRRRTPSRSRRVSRLRGGSRARRNSRIENKKGRSGGINYGKLAAIGTAGVAGALALRAVLRRAPGARDVITGAEALRVIREVSQELTDNPDTAVLESLQTRLDDVKTTFVDTIRVENGADEDHVVQEFYETEELLRLVKALRDRDSQQTAKVYLNNESMFELGNTLKNAMDKTTPADALVYFNTVDERRIPVEKDESIKNVRSAMKKLLIKLPDFATLTDKQQWGGIVEKVLKRYAKAQVLYNEHAKLFWQREPLTTALGKREQDDALVQSALKALKDNTIRNDEQLVLGEQKENIGYMNKIITDLLSTLYSLKREDYVNLFKNWWYAQNVNLCINLVKKQGVMRSLNPRKLLIQNNDLTTSDPRSMMARVYALAEKDFETDNFPSVKELKQMCNLNWNSKGRRNKNLKELQNFTWLSDKVY